MKKTLSIFMVMLLLTVTACSGNSNSDNLVPNVMGIDYSSAKMVLENAGFEVTVVEADASTILPTAPERHNRTVLKGQVFKVNDKTDPTYLDYKSYPIAENGKVTIYYAKEDYIYEKPETKNDEIYYDEYEDYDEDTDNEITTIPPTNSPDSSSSSNNTEWKQFLKEYEEWVDNYIIILKKYEENPADMTILSDYIDSIQKLAEWSEKADKIQVDLANDTNALMEYLETLSEIAKKLGNI